MLKPELLAPAGDWDCVRAAVENGADAIYFGLDDGFNARARAANFSVENLPELMHFLHQRNVRGYVTFNTLVFVDEVERARRLIEAMADGGVDALLVQDVGMAMLARSVSPSLPLHASTQMTMTSAETIRMAEALGMERVVLARELSIDEIQAIRDNTTMPLEVFVHGALCVAYSGQCLTSESLGGRSANRGQCAQACRLSYELYSDGQHVDLGPQKYLLSPQDLAAYDLTPQLIEAGVCSFKIEGRLKTPEYVANITRHYRHAIDEAWQQRSVLMTTEQQYEMEMSFSRGFSPGWLQGCDHKMLVPALSSAKRGVLAGHVVAIQGHRVVVELACGLQAGDGVVFEGDRAAGEEQGGRIFGVWEGGQRLSVAAEGERVALTFHAEAIDTSELSVGMKFWKTDDPRLNQRLRSTFDVADPVRRAGLRIAVHCAVGAPLRVQGVAASGARCDVTSDQVLAEAKKHPITEQILQEQLGRLGATVYQLEDIDATVEGNPMVPFSVLGRIRREMIEQLDACDLGRQDHQDAEADVGLDAMPQADLLSFLHDARATSSTDTTCEPRLRLLCRTMEQLMAALEHGVRDLYVEFQDIREYADAVSSARLQGASIYLATPRIQKPGEMGIFRAMERHQPNGYLVRNFSGFQFFQEQGYPVVADFSMNVANQYSAAYLMQQGAQRVTASYDLNREQLRELVGHTPPEWLECVVHQHMPMFHMEHCVFCAVLSPGTNKTNCGRPCDDHQVELEDRIGMKHPLTADVGCRNTLYNAAPQSSAEIIPALRQQGVRQFRVELLRESPEATVKTFDLYADLLVGRTEPRHVWKTLQATNRVGVTRGTLEERNPLAII